MITGNNNNLREAPIKFGDLFDNILLFVFFFLLLSFETKTSNLLAFVFCFFLEKTSDINNNHGSEARGRVKNEISNYQLPWLRGEAKVTVHRTNMRYEIFCFHFYEYGKAKKAEKDRRRKPQSQHWRQPGWLLSQPTVGYRS